MRIFIVIYFFPFIITNSCSSGENHSIDIINRKTLYEEKYEEFCDKAEKSTISDSIIYYSQKAIDIDQKLNRKTAKAISLLGFGYSQAGDYSLALDNYFIAASIYQDNGNQIGLATAFGYVADVYIMQQNCDNANHYLKLAIDIFESEKDSLRWAYSLHNLAFNLYTQDYLLDSSLFLFSKSKNIFDLLDVEIESAYCNGNKGLVYFKQGEIELAEKNLLVAIKILQKYNDTYALSDFMLARAKILFQKEKIDSAIVYGTYCYNISVKNNLSDKIRDISQNLAEFYSEKKQYDSAYYYHKIYAAYNDSLKNIKTVQQMADLRTTYEVSQKQTEVDKLESRRTFYIIAIGLLILTVLLAIGMVLMYYRNLKHERKFNKILEDQGKELQNSNQVKDRFFSIISHDLRSPISSLSAISLMINESLEHDTKDMLVEASDYIDKTVYSLTALLENLLNWAMSEQGKFPYSYETIDIKQLISEEVKTLATIAISKDIHLKLHLEDQLFIHGDNNSLKTVIRNLLSNAYKFTPKGGKVNISAIRNKNNEVEIAVEDNGVGISKDKLSNLFELKADKSTRGTDREKGLGLGLTLIHEFVCKNNGNITVQSALNQGSTFSVTFPIKS